MLSCYYRGTSSSPASNAKLLLPWHTLPQLVTLRCYYCGASSSPASNANLLLPWHTLPQLVTLSRYYRGASSSPASDTSQGVLRCAILHRHGTSTVTLEQKYTHKTRAFEFCNMGFQISRSWTSDLQVYALCSIVQICHIYLRKKDYNLVLESCI
jgi:hypothetical protein